MATTEEILRLVMEVQGQPQVAALQESLEQEEAAFRALIATSVAYANATEAQAGTAATKFTQRLKSLKTATDDVAQGGGTLHQTVQALGYAFQDFTSTSGDLGQKLNSISNNIPQLLGGLGQYAAAASLVFTGAIVAFRTFEPAITEFVGKVGKDLGLFTESSGSLIDGLKARIKELGDKPVKLSADVTALEGAQQLLEQLQAQQKAFTEFGKLRGSAAEASGALAKDAIAEVPGGADALQRDLAARVARQYEGQSGALRTRRADLASDQSRRDVLMAKDGLSSDELVELAGLNAGLETNREAIVALEKTLRDQAERTVGGLYGRATAGDAGGQRALADLLQGTGVGAYQDLALRLSQVGPESQEAIARTPRGREAQQQAEKARQAQEKARQDAERQQALANKATDEAEAENNAHAQKYNDALAKEQKAAAKEQEAAAKVRAGQDKGDVKRYLAEENRAIAGGGYVPQAERMLAGIGAQGNQVTDAYGRTRQLTPEQVQEFVRRQVESSVKRRNPGMDDERAWGISHAVTAGASQDLGRRMTALGSSGLTNQAKLINVATQLDNEVARLQALQAEQGRAIDGLVRRSRSRARPARKIGGH